ncbi:MAG: hypothetical protein U1E76_07685 [Planctomycetota bacterium]
MIRINLLPDELKRTDRTPPTIFLAVLTTVVLTCGALGVLGYLYIAVLGSVRTEQESAGRELQNLSPQAQYADSLEKEKAEYERRTKAIQSIAESRLVWTQKLDRLANLIHNDGNVDRHMVWLESLKVDMNAMRDRGLALKGFSGTDDLKKLSEFHKDLSHDTEFFANFAKITDPQGKLETSDGVVPPEAFAFDFKLTMAEKEPATAASARKAPAPAATAPRPSAN